RGVRDAEQRVRSRGTQPARPPPELHPQPAGPAGRRRAPPRRGRPIAGAGVLRAGPPPAASTSGNRAVPIPVDTPMDAVQRALTFLGTMTARPWAFLVVLAYGAL